MRVALIGPVPPRLGGANPGGVATHQVQLAMGLAGAGISASLLATNTRASINDVQLHTADVGFPLYRMARPERGLVDYARHVGLRHLIRYAARAVSETQLGSRREVLINVLWYRWFLAQVRPDVVHIQHPLERVSYFRRVQQLEVWRLPLVITAHSLFGEHDPDTIREMMAPNLRVADRVIAVSEHIAEQAVQLGVAPERVHVIHSGVDTGRFRPRDRVAARRLLGLPAEAPIVLFVGNLEPRKQLDVLIQAMARVRNSVPDARLLVVGSGRSAGVQDQSTRLKGLTIELGLAGCVQFVGPVDDDELLGYYAAADAFALPSSSEAQGLVALEAMASGLPVVATAVGGLLGTINSGETGYLVPPGEVEPLANRLIQLLQQAELRRKLGDAARSRVERKFSWSHAVEATMEVYRELAAGRYRAGRGRRDGARDGARDGCDAQVTATLTEQQTVTPK